MDTIIVENNLDGLFLIGLIISVIIAYGFRTIFTVFTIPSNRHIADTGFKEKSAKMKAASLKSKDGHTFDHDDDDDGFYS